MFSNVAPAIALSPTFCHNSVKYWQLKLLH